MTGLWVALIGVLTLATLRAVDPLRAWIGTPDRRLGLLAWITFPALFLAGYACVVACRDPARPARAATLGALVLGVWSAAELLGHPPLGLEFADAPRGRPVRPARVPRRRVPALRTARGRGRARPRRDPRRGDAAGALGAAGALLALARRRRARRGSARDRRRRRDRRCSSAERLRRHRGRRSQSRSCWSRSRSPSASSRRSAPAPPRRSISATAPARAASTSGASRRDTIADHPLLGVGPEGYRVVFPQEVDAAYVHKYGVAVYPDRAHNGMLDVTLDGRRARRLAVRSRCSCSRSRTRGARSRGRDPLDVALGAAVIAYIVQQQFLFPLAELDPIFWVLVGMLVARTPGADALATVRARWLVVPIAIATAVALVYGAREVLADRDLKRAANTADVTRRAPRRRRRDRGCGPTRSARGTSPRASRNAATRSPTSTPRSTGCSTGLDRSPRDPALRDPLRRAARRAGGALAPGRRHRDRPPGARPPGRRRAARPEAPKSPGHRPFSAPRSGNREPRRPTQGCIERCNPTSGPRSAGGATPPRPIRRPDPG